VSLIYPDDQAIVTSTNVEISWSATDVEGSALTFDLYLTTAPDAGTAYLTNITGKNVTIPLTAGKYYWQVIPHDGTDYGICISGIWEFTIDSTLQTPTTQLIAPVYNSIVTTGSVNLRWEVGAGFETTGLTFEIYLDTNEQPLKIASDHHGSIYSAQGLQDGETYYWTVIPKMQYGLGSVIGKCISGVWSFKVEMGIPAPVVNLLSPGNSKTVGTTEPVLLWAVTYPAATSIDYIIYLDTSPDPVKLLKSGHPDEFITASDLENTKTYHWIVIPIAGNVMGTCSSGVWQFTVDTGATVPEVELNFPINNVKINNLNPQLNWTLKYGGSGTVTFDIYLDTDSPPTKLIADDHSSGNNKQVSVNDDTKYYWTVIPTAGDVEGYCLSGVWSFETDTNYTPIFDLVLELSKSKLSIEQGQFETLDITVNNNGNVDDIIKLEVNIDPSSLDKKNVIITQTEFELTSHNTKTTHMTINIPKDAKTNDYKISIRAVSQGALGLDQNVYDEKTLDVEVSEEGASADDSLYVGSIIALIIIIVVLVILFLLTIKKKKRAEEKPEERVPLAPEAKAVPEGEAAPSAPPATPVGGPAVEPEPEKPPAPPEEAPPPPPPEPEPEPEPEEPVAEEPEPTQPGTPPPPQPEPEPEPVPEPEPEPKPEELAAEETTEEAPPAPTPKVVPKVTTPDEKEAPKDEAE
jgi:heme/copper-type cytochrome/quinol oxidase subunit 2